MYQTLYIFILQIKFRDKIIIIIIRMDLMDLKTIGEIWGKKTLFLQKKFQWWKWYDIFYSQGTLPLSFISSKINSNDFVTVVNTHLLTFLKRFCHKKHTFQLDNASIHTNFSTSQWFSANQMACLLPWPEFNGKPLGNTCTRDICQ